MPKGHGNRISKPPSPKQKRQADRLSQQRATYSLSTAGLPTRSWWTEPQAFANAEAEQRRMRDSKYGKAQTPTLLEP